MSDTIAYLEKAARNLYVIKPCPAFDFGIVNPPSRRRIVGKVALVVPRDLDTS
jgi:hypothetical protein